MFDDSDPLEPDAPVQPRGEADPEPTPLHEAGEAGSAQPQSDPAASPVQAESAASQPPVPPEPVVSPAQTRFKACRWHAEQDDHGYCSNRDVLPYAGKGGFDPEAWCVDCTLYKLRRTPKKRVFVQDDDYGY